MPLFEIEKDYLARLTDIQLEELIARLCEAEVSKFGGKLRDVMWSGSINAPDGGVDVQVKSDPTFDGDFIQRPETVFQAKKPSMPPSKIRGEMTEGTAPLDILKHLASKKGAYIIVCLSEDNSPRSHRSRVEAMEQVVGALPETADVHVDFYDRSRLQRWLAQHVTVQLWVREVLGRRVSGWRPFGRWSATPIDADDAMLLASGVEVLVPGHAGPVQLDKGIQLTRELLRKSPKAVRITGLSGVGKTRFVQALFEENVGETPLDRTTAIYADVSDELEPTPRSLLDELSVEGTDSLLVLDNCSADLHGRLASRLQANAQSPKLITIEYDIRDDSQQTTEVVRIVADGPEVAEKLVLRRFPDLGQVNALRIAKFAEGNARLALALSDVVPRDGTLSRLSDDELFKRIFHQRHDLDVGLMEQAEALSLVYSFSVDQDENGVDELAILGQLCEQTRLRMSRAAATLLERQVAQQRGRWRAILPHAIANRLASRALSQIPIDYLLKVFENDKNQRLLTSFCRRIGYLHDSAVARNLVYSWFDTGGMFEDYCSLSTERRKLFHLVAPVAPESVLKSLERSFGSFGLEALSTPCDTSSLQNSELSNLLFNLAYDDSLFDRCASILLAIALRAKNETTNSDAAEKLENLCQLRLSGTHATPLRRGKLIENCLLSDDEAQQLMGIRLLHSSLESRHWSSGAEFSFGARPRDYGFHPSPDETIEWFTLFLNIGKRAAQKGSKLTRDKVRSTLAHALRGLWRSDALFPVLRKIAEELNEDEPWIEGWKEIRTAIYLDGKQDDDGKIPNDLLVKLRELDKLLKPKDIASSVRAFVASSDSRYMLDEEFDYETADGFRESSRRLAKIAFQLGTVARNDAALINEVAPSLFSAEYSSHQQHEFGRGLIEGYVSPRRIWDQLVRILHEMETERFCYGVLTGVLQAVSEADRPLAQNLLDECLQDDLLRHGIVRLHPVQGFDEVDFIRCLAALEFGDVPAFTFEDLYWQSEYLHLSNDLLVTLTNQLSSYPRGPDSIAHGLAMRLHGRKSESGILSPEIVRLALVAAGYSIGGRDTKNQMADHHWSEVLDYCLKKFEFPVEEMALIDAIFDNFDRSYGLLSDWNDTVATIVKYRTEMILNRAFVDPRTSERDRFVVFEGGIRNKYPLAGVSPDVLVTWCRESGLQESWSNVAQVVPAFTMPKEGSRRTLSEHVTALLKHAPNPSEVVEAIIPQARPTSGWTADRAHDFDSRIAAFEELSNHPVQSVRAAVADAIEKARAIEAEMWKWLQNEDRERGQSFE
ncbi:hypothetical protein [Tropicimonas sp. IMCC6043]|uniref:hypothetical protein n=1 Tax=Tropicimonas sp. IMCC6043 TaxID=2510645 RepID=UPI00101C67C4|nr:hypothetical protein [Tropicimonas sp. IMCC6043]RYH07778.1 hypothetical protein EU800_18820 [Tropicimonas sp. IMCC6043]